MDFTVYEAETKALISCVFVFPYAKMRFCHAEVHIFEGTSKAT